MYFEAQCLHARLIARHSTQPEPRIHHLLQALSESLSTMLLSPAKPLLAFRAEHSRWGASPRAQQLGAAYED